MRCILVLLVLAVALRPPFSRAQHPPSVAADLYAGGEPNGIPTPQCHNDPRVDIFDVINLLLGHDQSSPDRLGHNADADPFWVPHDGVWQDLEGTVAFLAITANNENRLGVYTDVGGGLDRHHVLGPYSGYDFSGDGSRERPFPAADLEIASKLPFGWYLESKGIGYRGSDWQFDGVTTVLYSEPRLNDGGYDHLMTYDLGPVGFHAIFADGTVTWVHFERAFLLAWEDLGWTGSVRATLGDDDYDDMVYVVGKVQPLAWNLPDAGMQGGSGTAQRTESP